MEEELVSSRKMALRLSYSDSPGSGLFLDCSLFRRNIFSSSYFAFHVNAFKGRNSASASVTQPYFFF